MAKKKNVTPQEIPPIEDVLNNIPPEDMPSVYVGFGMTDTGEIDIDIFWNKESSQNIGNLGTLLTLINMGNFQNDIYEILQNKAQDSEETKLYVQALIKDWITKIKLSKAITNHKSIIKPTEVFGGVKSLISRSEEDL